jgi:hypothetical protein
LKIEERNIVATTESFQPKHEAGPVRAMSSIEVEAAHAEAMKIMTDAKKLLEQTGLEVSLITRCPNGAKWPVLMLEVGQTYADIENVRNGKR